MEQQEEQEEKVNQSYLSLSLNPHSFSRRFCLLDLKELERLIFYELTLKITILTASNHNDRFLKKKKKK